MRFDTKRYFKGSILGWGVILVFFGLLMFCNKQGFFNNSTIYSPKHYATYMGIIFLLTRNLGSAAVAFLIAAVINLGLVVNTFKTYSDLLLPAVLVLAGLAIILFKFNKHH